MLLLQLVSCLALVAGASSQTHSESSELGRLLCTNKSRIADIVHEYEMETEYDFGDVLLNCCVEGPGASLKKAIVSAFINDSSSNSTGVRFEFLYVSGTVVVRELRSAAALSYTWDGTHCYECNTSAPVGGELCSGECVTHVLWYVVLSLTHTHHKQTPTHTTHPTRPQHAYSVKGLASG